MIWHRVGAPTGSGDITEIGPRNGPASRPAHRRVRPLGLARRSGQGQAIDRSHGDGFGSQTN